MHGFGAFAQDAFFELDEVADARARLEMVPGAEASERTDDHAVVETAFDGDAMRLDGDIITEKHVLQDAASTNTTPRPDARPAQELNARLKHRIFARSDVRID